MSSAREPGEAALRLRPVATLGCVLRRRHSMCRITTPAASHVFAAPERIVAGRQLWDHVMEAIRSPDGR